MSQCAKISLPQGHRKEVKEMHRFSKYLWLSYVMCEMVTRFLWLI